MTFMSEREDRKIEYLRGHRSVIIAVTQEIE